MTEQNARTPPEPATDAELVELAAKTFVAEYWEGNPTWERLPPDARTNLKLDMSAVIAAIAPALVAQERAKIAKQFDDVRSELNNISRATEDEGDRVYFGSTNDADDLRRIAERFESFAISAELAIKQEDHNAE